MSKGLVSAYARLQGSPFVSAPLIVLPIPSEISSLAPELSQKNLLELKFEEPLSSSTSVTLNVYRKVCVGTFGLEVSACVLKTGVFMFDVVLLVNSFLGILVVVLVFSLCALVLTGLDTVLVDTISAVDVLSMISLRVGGVTA